MAEGISISDQLRPEKQANTERTSTSERVSTPTATGPSGGGATQKPPVTAAPSLTDQAASEKIASIHGEGGPRSLEAVATQAEVTAPMTALGQKNEEMSPSPTLKLAEAAPVEGSPEATQAAIDATENVERVSLSPGGAQAVAAIEAQQANEFSANRDKAINEFTKQTGNTIQGLRELNPGMSDQDIVNKLAGSGQTSVFAAIGQGMTDLISKFSAPKSAEMNAFTSEFQQIDLPVVLGALSFVFDALKTPIGTIALGVDQHLSDTGLSSATVKRIAVEANAQGLSPDDPRMIAQYGKLASDTLMDGLRAIVNGPEHLLDSPETLVAGAAVGIDSVMSLFLGFGPGLKALKDVPALRQAIMESDVAMSLMGRSSAEILAGNKFASYAALKAAIYASGAEEARATGDVAAAARRAGAGAEQNASLAVAKGRLASEGTGGVTAETKAYLDARFAAQQAELRPTLVRENVAQAYADAAAAPKMIGGSVAEARTSGSLFGKFLGGEAGSVSAENALGAGIVRAAGRGAGAVARAVRAHSPELRNIADQIRSAGKLETSAPTYRVAVHEPTAKRMAKFYEEAVSNPNDKAVKRAYSAFTRETDAQAEALKKAGYKAEPWTGEGQPYKNSAEMRADVQNNKHIYYFQTKPEDVANHGDVMSVEQNNTFRWVHDVFGHAMEGNEFGPHGEENAWNAHASMYSPEAQKAMTTETRLQNSTVNYGKYGDINRASPATTVYPEQKAVLPPREFLPRPPANAADRGAIRSRLSEHATPELIQKAGRWYKDAAAVAHEWSDSSGLGGTFKFENVSALIAALSPQQVWTNSGRSLDNLKAAYNMLKSGEEFKAANPDFKGVPPVPEGLEAMSGQSTRQATKAWNIMFADDPWKLLPGSKESPFGLNIADLGNRAVVDRHIRAGMPSVAGKNPVTGLTPSEHGRIQQAYADVLAEMKANGTLPLDFMERDLQALDWGIISKNDLSFRGPGDYAHEGSMPRPGMPPEPPEFTPSQKLDDMVRGFFSEEGGSTSAENALGVGVAKAAARGITGGLKFFGENTDIKALTKVIQDSTGGRLNGVKALGDAIKNGGDLSGVPDGLVAKFIEGFVSKGLTDAAGLTPEQITRIAAYAAADTKAGIPVVEATQKAVANEALTEVMNETAQHSTPARQAKLAADPNRRGFIGGEGGSSTPESTPIFGGVIKAAASKLSPEEEALAGRSIYSATSLAEQEAITRAQSKVAKVKPTAAPLTPEEQANAAKLGGELPPGGSAGATVTAPERAGTGGYQVMKLATDAGSPLQTAVEKAGGTAEHAAWIADPKNDELVQGVLSEANVLPDSMKGDVAARAVRDLADGGVNGGDYYGRWLAGGGGDDKAPLFVKTTFLRTFVINNLLNVGVTVYKAFSDIAQIAATNIEILTKPLVSRGGTTGVTDIPIQIQSFFAGFGRGLTDDFVTGFRAGKFGLEADLNIPQSLDRIRSGEAGRVAQAAAHALDVATVWQFNTRSLSAVTGLVSRPQHDLALVREGLRIAKTSNGLDGRAARDFARKFVANPPAEADEAAWKMAAKATWTNPAGGPAEVLSGLRKADGSWGSNAAFLAFPFVNTITNIAARGAEYIPVLNVKGLVKTAGLTEHEIAARRTHAVMGLIATYSLVQHAIMGNLTGDGPANVSEKIALINRGWKPNSIKIGDAWVENRNFGPLAVLLNAVGNYHDTITYDFKKQDKNDVAANAASVVLSIGRTILDEEHYLTAMAGLIDAFHGGSESTLESTIAGTASEFIPQSGNLKLAESIQEPRTPAIPTNLPFGEGVAEHIFRSLPTQIRPGRQLPKGVRRPYSGGSRLTGISQNTNTEAKIVPEF